MKRGIMAAGLAVAGVLLAIGVALGTLRLAETGIDDPAQGDVRAANLNTTTAPVTRPRSRADSSEDDTTTEEATTERVPTISPGNAIPRTRDSADDDGSRSASDSGSRGTPPASPPPPPSAPRTTRRATPPPPPPPAPAPAPAGTDVPEAPTTEDATMGTDDSGGGSGNSGKGSGGGSSDD